jgi:hypothetical protein
MKKHSLFAGLALLLLLEAATACRPRVETPDAGPLAAPMRPDAGPLVILSLHLEASLPDGGTLSEPLDATTTPLFPVVQTLLITSNLPLHNYRLRILDEVDRALASDDVPEETGSGLRYRVALLSPLRPGHRYTVLLDAQSGTTLDDGRGVALNEQRFEFRVEGERERDVPVKKHAVKHRHRRGDETH